MTTENKTNTIQEKGDYIESRYVQQIMKDMENGVLAINNHGKILYLNPQMASYFEDDDLIGSSIHSLIMRNIDASNDAFWDAILEATYHHRLHHQKKVRFVSPSGKRRSLHVTSSYLGSDSNDDMTGIVITVSDETELDELAVKKRDSTLVLVGMIIVVCLTVFISELHTFLNGSFPHELIARTTEISGFVFLLIALKFTSLTIKDFGLLPVNLKKELFESALVITAMVGVMAIAKWIMTASGSSFFPEGTPFFDFSAPPSGYYIKYIFIAFAQELITKCGLQKSISKVLDSKHGGWVAIFITSFMFMALHLQHGLIYMVGAGILSAVLAILYSRHNSLLGTFLVHYSFGIMGLVLGWID